MRDIDGTNEVDELDKTMDTQIERRRAEILHIWIDDVMLSYIRVRK